MLKLKYGNIIVGSKEYNNAAKLAQALSNPEKYIWYNAKKRAQRDGMEFDIEVTDIVIPNVCPILGIKLAKVRKGRLNAPSLDRKDNSKGYIKGNIAVISLRANRYKTDLTLKQIESLYRYSQT